MQMQKPNPFWVKQFEITGFKKDSMKITANRKYEQFRIYFDGILHLHIKLLELVGFQSWMHGQNEYFIEYYFTGGAKITTAYGEKSKWIEVLKLIEENITVLG